MIELAIAMSILLIGVVAVSSASARLHGLRKSSREITIGQNALRAMAERIHARAYTVAEDDPGEWAEKLTAIYSAGGEFGDTFDVRGLNVDRGEVSIGSLQILTDETLTDEALGFQIGMPRDLNGDGDALDTDVSATARILPVLLTLQWTGQNRTSEITQGFFVTSY